MTDVSATGALFDATGFLNRERLSSDAIQVMEQCTTWLIEIDRAVYLPIDLMVVLLERGHEPLRRAIATSARGIAEDPSIAPQLRALSRRVERDATGPARLHLDQFSLGFTGIIQDALAWANEAGRVRLNESDLARVLRWRAELQESASVRWAIRQLAQPGGELLFEPDGSLRRGAFSTALWERMQAGMVLSATSGLGFLGTPHMIAALCLARGPLVQACEELGIPARRLHDDLLSIVGHRDPEQEAFALTRATITPRLVRMLVTAAQLAEREGDVVREAYLLDAFLADGGSSLDVVRAQGLLPTLRRQMDAAERGSDRHSRVSVFDGAEVLPIVSSDGEATSDTPTLDALGRDLTADARAGRLSTVLGRDTELQRVINVLMRSEQRNPLLTGRAGVGKTALAAALAQRIVDGTVPEALQSMRVVEINGASLVGGTSYRGELEARIKGLLDECTGDVILFIDEAHAVFAPRSSSGQPAEVPNHFKAALASGRLAVVAATTEMEYRRWIEEDPALRRRFERIEIPELSRELTRRILAHLAPAFEKRYGVPVTPEAVDASVELSHRFMPEQALPDKAKKLLMDATIAVASEKAASKRAESGDESQTGTPSKRVVTRIDVARQIAQKTGAPLDRIATGSIRWWTGLEARLAKHVIAQEEAVRQVARRLVSSRLAGVGRQRPQGVFLFAGPPGVGKRELAVGMATEIFGSPDAMIRLEMADFGESHAVSRLIGTPPGYVGYQDEDLLVTPLRRSPSCVVLLENFDRAHPRVQDRIIRLLADGEITDTRGMAADASHAVFVLTLDVELNDRGRIGFGGATSDDSWLDLRRIDAGLADRFRGYPIDTIPFLGMRSPGQRLGEQLLEHRLGAFRVALREEYGLELDIAETILTELHERVGRLEDARGIEALFRELIIEPVSRKLLHGVEEDVVRVSAREPRPA